MEKIFGNSKGIQQLWGKGGGVEICHRSTNRGKRAVSRGEGRGEREERRGGREETERGGRGRYFNDEKGSKKIMTE